MKKRNIVASIDVGTTKICTILADVTDGVPRIVGVGISPSKGLHKGLVVNINEARESIRDSVRKAEQTSNYKMESAYVGVTGRHVTSNNNHGVVAITRNDRVVRPDDLKRVLTSAQSVKTPADRKLLHVIPRSYAVDGQAGVKNPIGMHGFRLDVETHVITAAVTSIQNLVKCIRSLGIDIEDLVLEPLASSEAVLSEDERQVGVVMADIGGGTTDVAIFREGSIWHTSILPVAGYQLTRDVAIGLGLPFEIAEEMKKKYGSVMPVYEGKGDTAPAISKDGHGVSYQDLCDIIRARVEEILKLIVLEMPNSNYEELVPAGLVLTGGSSNLSGLATLGREILNMPVRIGVPNNMYGIGDMLQDPAYATSVGLLLWGSKYQGKKQWKAGGFGGAILKLASQLGKLFR
ncbi:MAG: cell division protein FtsA [Chloroflexi bacterium RBG_16_50_11]|nr:MAG: cell division protein FtsA [Chloroflexi bacterium RBG_16_50_11]